MKYIGTSIALLLAVAFAVSALGYQANHMQGVWLYLDRLGLVLGIIAFVPILYGVWKYLQYVRSEEKERKLIHTQLGTQPAVLIVSIGGSCIRNAVENFLRKNGGFEDFDFESRVFVVHRNSNQISASDVDSIMKEFEEKVGDIRLKAADKIHLFVKGPIAIGTMVGEVLANGVSTLVYHHQDGYQNWGALRR
ncbi:MAG: hypothetical protein COC22_00620 [Flavobacteriaceae bacterium]|nr:MAG: hypothetical protein COC22_00620 [Flavobacteriaceae bacterium]